MQLVSGLFSHSSVCHTEERGRAAKDAAKGDPPSKGPPPFDGRRKKVTSSRNHLYLVFPEDAHRAIKMHRGLRLRTPFKKRKWENELRVYRKRTEKSKHVTYAGRESLEIFIKFSLRNFWQRNDLFKIISLQWIIKIDTVNACFFSHREKSQRYETNFLRISRFFRFYIFLLNKFLN